MRKKLVLIATALAGCASPAIVAMSRSAFMLAKTLARAASLVVLFSANTARADAADILGDFVGYTVIATKTIDSFADRGKEKKDGFEGCDFDRVIIFTDGTAVTCRTFSYTYSYRPKAVILGRQATYQGTQLTLLKMVVGDAAYDLAGR